jgi:hypothetical protein
MLEALCRQSSTTLDIVHAEDGPPITQRTSGLDRVSEVAGRFGIVEWLLIAALSIGCGFSVC